MWEPRVIIIIVIPIISDRPVESNAERDVKHQAPISRRKCSRWQVVRSLDIFERRELKCID